MRRADDTIQPCPARQPGEARSLGGSTVGHTGTQQISIIQAGENGDGHHVRAGQRGSASCGQHGVAPGGVNGEDGRGQRREAAHGAGHGVGNVVEFEIEEQRQRLAFHDSGNAGRAMGAEEFEAELYPANMRRNGSDQRARSSDIGRIDRHEHRIAHGVRLRWRGK